MTEKTRGIITVKFSDGQTFNQWESVSIRERFDDALGSYRFVVKPTRDKLRYFQERLLKGELIGIQVNSNPYATPMIETVTTTVDRAGGVVIDCECKSVLLAATEASADPTIYEKQAADVPIETLVLKVLKPFGFSEIKTDQAGHAMTLTGKPIGNRAPAITADTLKAKDAQVQDNETCYGYCARLFSRLGVALRVNWEGRLLLAAPDYDQDPLYTIDDTGEGERAVSMSLKESNNGQFSKIVIRGKGTEETGKKQTAQPQAALKQTKFTGRHASATLEASAAATYDVLSAGEPYAKVNTKDFTSTWPLYNSSQHPFKPRYLVDKRSRDNERCQSFCKLVHTKNAPNAWELTAVVDGLMASNGAVWAIDTICRVNNTVLDLNYSLWVHEVTLEQSRRGSHTTLRLIPKHSLILGDIPS